MLAVAGQILAQMDHFMRQGREQRGRKAIVGLADAHRQHRALAQALLDQQLGEEMRFARSASAKRALVSGRRKQRQKDPRRKNLKFAACRLRRCYAFCRWPFESQRSLFLSAL